MSTENSANIEDLLRVTITEDKMTARLQVLDTELVSDIPAEICMILIQSRDLYLTGPDLKLLKANVADYNKGQKQETLLELKGVPKQDGKDGQIVWAKGLIKKHTIIHDEEVEDEAAEAATANIQVDHYDSSTLSCVSPGQILGKVVPPTEGEDGTDVTGKSLTARAGRPGVLRISQTIATDSYGQLVAQAAGIFRIRGREVCIEPELSILGNVDFKTGHIDVNCDVEVSKGVRDRFKVISTGSVTIRGLIEAATIKAAKNLTAVTGMAAKTSGYITVGGNLDTRYLDKVHGIINGNAKVERELMHCHLVVRGELDMDRGAIVGGEMRVAKKAVVQDVGAQGGDKTLIGLGSIPKFDIFLEKIREALERYQEERNEVEEKLKMMTNMKADRTEQGKKEIAELTEKFNSLAGEVAKVEMEYDKLLNLYEENRHIELVVHKNIFEDTFIGADGKFYHFKKPFKGPVSIERGPKGDLILKNLDSGNVLPMNRAARSCPTPEFLEIQQGEQEEEVEKKKAG